MAVRLIIADDSFLVREALVELLATVPQFDLVAVAESIGELRAAIDSERPDVVLTDIRMPPFDETDGVGIAAELRQTHPEVGVVILSQYVEPTFALELFAAGSEQRAYLLKERVGNRNDLVAAIEAVNAGGSFVDPKVVETLIAERARSHSALSELTAREHEVLAEVAKGRSNSAIAESLFLTKRAVEKHINAIFMKLKLRDAEDTSSRVAATLIFLAEGRNPADAGTARSAGRSPIT